MIAQILTLCTRPDQAWLRIRQQEQRNSLHYLLHLLVLALIPAVCLFIGTTRIGWSLVEAERVRLDSRSALHLSLLLYATSLLGVFVMGAFVRWMSRTFEARPDFNQCVGFIAYSCTPFFLAGFAALYPSRWLAIAVLLLAGLHASYLLFAGLPTFMRLDSNQSALYASSVWGVALLTLVTLLVSMILVWQLALQPRYERSVVEDQGYPQRQERAQLSP